MQRSDVTSVNLVTIWTILETEHRSYKFVCVFICGEDTKVHRSQINSIYTEHITYSASFFLDDHDSYEYILINRYYAENNCKLSIKNDPHWPLIRVHLIWSLLHINRNVKLSDALLIFLVNLESIFKNIIYFNISNISIVYLLNNKRLIKLNSIKLNCIWSFWLNNIMFYYLSRYLKFNLWKISFPIAYLKF